MKFIIVIGSVRKNRVSDQQATWTKKVASEIAGEHEWSILDLKEYDLPLFDEAFPPMAQRRGELSGDVSSYLEKMNDADGYIFVTPEYNHGTSAAMKNAIDYLDFQLVKKPVAIASHGSVGGARANEQVRLVVNSNLGAIPVPASHTFFGNVAELISEDGEIADGQEGNRTSAEHMIESLVWYAGALKAAREA